MLMMIMVMMISISIMISIIIDQFASCVPGAKTFAHLRKILRSCPLGGLGVSVDLAPTTTVGICEPNFAVASLTHVDLAGFFRWHAGRTVAAGTRTGAAMKIVARVVSKPTPHRVLIETYDQNSFGHSLLAEKLAAHALGVSREYIRRNATVCSNPSSDRLVYWIFGI